MVVLLIQVSEVGMLNQRISSVAAFYSYHSNPAIRSACYCLPAMHAYMPNGPRYRRLEGRDSLTKLIKPKATKKLILAGRIQPPACTPC